MKSAREDKTLFTSKAEDYESTGISKGPTGYSSLALEPLKGLDSERIANLAANVVSEMLKPLTNNVSTEKAGPPPSILAASIYPESNDVNRNNPLVLLVFGTAGSSVSFSIGDTIQNIPMEELSPGHYYGEYIPLPQDSFEAAAVEVSLQDTVGRSTAKIVNSKLLTLK